MCFSLACWPCAASSVCPENTYHPDDNVSPPNWPQMATEGPAAIPIANCSLPRTAVLFIWSQSDTYSDRQTATYADTTPGSHTAGESILFIYSFYGGKHKHPETSHLVCSKYPRPQVNSQVSIKSIQRKIPSYSQCSQQGCCQCNESNQERHKLREMNVYGLIKAAIP